MKITVELTDPVNFADVLSIWCQSDFIHVQAVHRYLIAEGGFFTRKWDTGLGANFVALKVRDSKS